MSATMTEREAGACLDALGALGLWAPWKSSAADREAGIDPATSRSATVASWRRAAELAGVAPRAVLAACQGFTGDRWPTPGEIIESIKRATPAAPAGACIRRGREMCNLDGLVSVAAHYLDAQGEPRVWVGATWCDCDRGQTGASRQAQPAEKNGPERPRGLTVSEHRARYEATGRMLDYIIGPESWQKWPAGDPRSTPPSAETLAKAAGLAKLGEVPTWIPEGDTRPRVVERQWADRDEGEDQRW